jgi:hypothetical protein
VERCPTCGFDPTALVPSDAAVAARSFPRRYRAALEPVDDEEVPAEAVEHAVAAVQAMAAAAEWVRPGHPFERGDLGTVAAALAEGIERLPSEEWDGPRGEAARRAIHMGVHHLRAAEDLRR